MKKLSFSLLFCILFGFYSCQDVSDDVLAGPDDSGMSVRSGSDSDFISQLADIPVNITLAPGVAATDKMYLAAQRDGESNVAWLWMKDDGSGRQKFFIEKIYAPLNGKQRYKIRAQGGAYKGRNHVGEEIGRNYPVLWGSLPSGKGGWYFELDEVTNKYKIVGPLTGTLRYLQAKSFNDKNLLVSSSYPRYGMGDWEIEPIGGLTIESVSYYLTSANNTIQKPDFLTEVEMINNTDIQQSVTANFSQSATETSSFSQTEGYSRTVSYTMDVGIPLFVDNKINTSVTTSTQWTFGKTESKTDTRSYNFPLIVPANTRYKARAIVSMYDANARYVARCRVNNSNRIVLLEGNWEGIRAGHVKYEIFKDNVLIKRISEKPSTPIVIE